MSLKEQITNDMKNAMRNKETARLSTIRMLLAAIKQKEVDERINPNNEQIIAIVDKLIKQRKDSITAYEQAGRTDSAEKEAAEITVLQAYLPQRITEEEIITSVAKIIADSSASGPGDMGKIMSIAKKELASKADMSLVSAIVKKALTGS